MKDVSKALLSVVRLETFESEVGLTRNALVSKATGFLYKNKIGQPYLITNKHVVCNPRDDYYPDFLLAHVRIARGPLSKITMSKTLQMRFELNKDRMKMWNALRDTKVDIAALKIDATKIKNWFVTYLSSEDVLPTDSHFSLGSRVIVLGFPKGAFYDEFSNLPVVRNATIATDPQLTFNKKRCFLVDANLPEGMSGSPVVSLPRSIYEKDNKPVYEDVNCYLLGIFSSEWLWGDEPLGLNTVWRPELIEEATLDGD